jgi:hypothetical protein
MSRDKRIEVVRSGGVYIFACGYTLYLSHHACIVYCRYKCPFHGKIIPRDAMGRPEGSDSDTEEPADTSRAELAEVTRDIELATGRDLGSKKDKKGKKRKHSGLTDLKRNSNTSRARLERIVLNKEALKRVADETDRVRKKIIDEKFGNNFNYALKPTY